MSTRLHVLEDALGQPFLTFALCVLMVALINRVACRPQPAEETGSHLNSTGTIQLCHCWLKLSTYSDFCQNCSLVKNPDSLLSF